jgi:hypothetical protein
MTCTVVTLPSGVRAIVCGPTRRCACGRKGVLLCDWKVGDGTCDKPICGVCSTSPAPDKDLCPEHAEAWKRWRAGDRTPAPTKTRGPYRRRG